MNRLGDRGCEAVAGMVYDSARVSALAKRLGLLRINFPDDLEWRQAQLSLRQSGGSERSLETQRRDWTTL